MAEFDTPAPDPRRLAAAKHAAEWDEKFPLQTLAQRSQLAAGRERNKEVYAEQVLQERAFAQEQEMRTSRVAQDLYFKSRGLEMQQAAAYAAQQERDMRMKHEEQLFPEKLAAQQALTTSRLASERAAVEREKTITRLNAVREEHTTRFHSGLAGLVEKGVAPGTKEFRGELEKLIALNPGARREDVANVLKISDIDDDPNEFIARAREMREQFPKATVTIGAKGVSVTDRPVADDVAKDANEFRKQEDYYLKEITKAERDKDKSTKELWEGRLSKLRANAPVAAAQQAAAPAAAPSAPAKPLTRAEQLKLAQEAVSNPNLPKEYRERAQAILNRG